jgi:succinate-semialdehyde dehydrogenase/glutarate-semialdehyde dehydrogenase
MEMTQPQMIVDDILPGVKKDLWWQPYNEKVYLGLKGVLEMLYEPSPGKRIRGTWRLLKILGRIFGERR